MEISIVKRSQICWSFEDIIVGNSLFFKDLINLGNMQSKEYYYPIFCLICLRHHSGDLKYVHSVKVYSLQIWWRLDIFCWIIYYTQIDEVTVNRFEASRALKFFRLESLRVLKPYSQIGGFCGPTFSRLKTFRALKSYSKIGAF